MHDSPMRPLARRLLQFGFRQLYTRFAWAYDTVAAVVSQGEWNDWGRAALGFIEKPGGRPANPPRASVLEIAHGPGALHLALRQAGYHAVGIDLSPQMSQMAARRLSRAGLSNSLARADVMRLPFPDAAFVSLISTFPAEFIINPRTLAEAARVLIAGGRFVIVPSAASRQGQLLAQAAAAWQRISHLSRRESDSIESTFNQAGFTLQTCYVPSRHADVIVWVCTKDRA